MCSMTRVLQCLKELVVLAHRNKYKHATVYYSNTTHFVNDIKIIYTYAWYKYNTRGMLTYWS